VGFGFGLIKMVYCDDDIVVSDSKNSNIDTDDKSYHFSISKTKQFVKDGFDYVLKVLSD